MNALQSLAMRRSAVALLAAAFACVSVAAEARLVAQQVQGTQRICIYEVPPGTIGSGTVRRGQRIGTNYRQRAVGLGEPCPATWREPPPERPAPIPSLAVLDSQRYERGATVCVYRLGEQEYSRRLSAGRRCPMTPHF